MYNAFETFGQKVNIFEVKMNRALIKSKGLGEIQPLREEIAFNKGVEWFTEIFVFYGIMIAICSYEIRKSVISSKKQK